jgi:hypothetical protein
MRLDEAAYNTRTGKVGFGRISVLHKPFKIYIPKENLLQIP